MFAWQGGSTAHTLHTRTAGCPPGAAAALRPAGEPHPATCCGAASGPVKPHFYSSQPSTWQTGCTSVSDSSGCSSIASVLPNTQRTVCRLPCITAITGLCRRSGHWVNTSHRTAPSGEACLQLGSSRAGRGSSKLPEGVGQVLVSAGTGLELLLAGLQPLGCLLQGRQQGKPPLGQLLPLAVLCSSG